MDRVSFIFFFNDTATTEIYTLSLHDALPIYQHEHAVGRADREHVHDRRLERHHHRPEDDHQHDEAQPEHRAEEERRSEEHTSELQSRQYLVCRLLLEKKKKSAIRAIDFESED